MARDGNGWQNFFEESKSPHNTPHNKLFKTVVISGRNFSSVNSRSQRFWQLLATPEYKKKRRGRTYEKCLKLNEIPYM